MLSFLVSIHAKPRFAIPQITARTDGINEDTARSEAALAVQSIPAYVEACDLLLGHTFRALEVGCKVLGPWRVDKLSIRVAPSIQFPDPPGSREVSRSRSKVKKVEIQCLNYQLEMDPPKSDLTFFEPEKLIQIHPNPMGHGPKMA